MDYAEIRTFYNTLEDEESRFVFRHRLNYLFTGDRKFLYDMTADSNRLFHPAKIIRNIKHLLENANQFTQGAIIYSMGENTANCLKQLNDKNIKVIAICDLLYQQWQPDGYMGSPVISPEELVKNDEYRKCAVVMSNAVWQQVNTDTLITHGFSSDNIFVIEGQYNFTNYPYKPSYFQQDFINLYDNETYVDVGCYTGDTIKQFFDACKGKYKKIYGFEPHPVNFKTTNETVKRLGLQNVHILPNGAWSSEGEFAFISEYGDAAKAGGARIMDHGDMHIKTTTIDKALGDENVTFIKMDIEGAELEALKGAENTIKRCKPKLAICIYHKPEDIVEIPMYLFSIMPDYRFYLRHHNFIWKDGNQTHDTVLYAK